MIAALTVFKIIGWTAIACINCNFKTIPSENGIEKIRWLATAQTLIEAQNKRRFRVYSDIAVAQCESILFIESYCQTRNDSQDFDPKD